MRRFFCGGEWLTSGVAHFPSGPLTSQKKSRAERQPRVQSHEKMLIYMSVRTAVFDIDLAIFLDDRSLVVPEILFVFVGNC